MPVIPPLYDTFIHLGPGGLAVGASVLLACISLVVVKRGRLIGGVAYLGMCIMLCGAGVLFEHDQEYDHAVSAPTPVILGTVLMVTLPILLARCFFSFRAKQPVSAITLLMASALTLTALLGVALYFPALHSTVLDTISNVSVRILSWASILALVAIIFYEVRSRRAASKVG